MDTITFRRNVPNRFYIDPFRRPRMSHHFVRASPQSKRAVLKQPGAEVSVMSIPLSVSVCSFPGSHDWLKADGPEVTRHKEGES